MNIKSIISKIRYKIFLCKVFYIEGTHKYCWACKRRLRKGDIDKVYSEGLGMICGECFNESGIEKGISLIRSLQE